MTAAAPPRLAPRAGTPAPDAVFGAWAKGASACAFVLLFAGGMVTSTGSGLAVPDWPLSFGTLNPPMIGGVFFEHGHRLMAGAVASVVLVLAALSFRPSVPPSARLAARLAAGAVLVQALLGGLTVLLRLPPAVSIAHACLGQGVFCVLLAAFELSSPRERDLRAGRTAAWAAAAFAAAYLQLALGALIRHSVAGPVWHVAWAFGTAGLAAAAAVIARRSGVASLGGPSAALLLLLPVQLALGWLAYLIRTDATLGLDFRSAALWRTAHLSGGAAILGALLLLALRARRAARPA